MKWNDSFICSYIRFTVLQYCHISLKFNFVAACKLRQQNFVRAWLKCGPADQQTGKLRT